jgi:hypothetical protein
MNKQEKAEIILEALDEYLQVDWNFKDFYIKGIMKGLTQIENNEKKDSSDESKANGYYGKPGKSYNVIEE